MDKQFYNDNLSALAGHAEALSNELSLINRSSEIIGISEMERIFRHDQSMLHATDDLDHHEQLYSSPLEQHQTLSGNKRVRDDGDLIITDYVHSMNNINNSILSQQHQQQAHLISQHELGMTMLQQQQHALHLQQQQHQLEHHQLQQHQLQHSLHQQHHHQQQLAMQHQAAAFHRHINSHHQQQLANSHHQQQAQHLHQQQQHHLLGVSAGHNGVEDILAAANMNVQNVMLNGGSVMTLQVPMTPTSLTFTGVPLTHLDLPPQFLSIIGNPSLPGSTTNASNLHGSNNNSGTGNSTSNNNSTVNVMPQSYHLHNHHHNIGQNITQPHINPSQATQQQNRSSSTKSKKRKKRNDSSNGPVNNATSSNIAAQHVVGQSFVSGNMGASRADHSRLFGNNGGSLSDDEDEDDNDDNFSPAHNITNMSGDLPSSSFKARSMEEQHCIILERSTNTSAKCSNTRYRCIYCQFEFVGGPQKIRVHLTGKRENGTRLSKCEKVPEDIRQLMEGRMKGNKKRNQLGSTQQNLLSDIRDGADQDDDCHEENGPLVPGLHPRNVEEQHCIVLSRSVSSSSKSSNSKYKCIYCRFRFVGGPQKIRVQLTGIPEGGTRVIKCTKAPKEVVGIMECRRKAPKMSSLLPYAAAAAAGLGGLNGLGSSTVNRGGNLLSSHNTLSALNFALPPNMSHNYGISPSLVLGLGNGTGSGNNHGITAAAIMNTLGASGDNSNSNQIAIPLPFVPPISSSDSNHHFPNLMPSHENIGLSNEIHDVRMNNNNGIALEQMSHNCEGSGHQVDVVTKDYAGSHDYHFGSSNHESQDNISNAHQIIGNSDHHPNFDALDNLTALAHTAMSNNLDEIGLLTSSSASSSAGSVHSDDQLDDDDTLGMNVGNGIYNFELASAHLAELNRGEAIHGSQPGVTNILLAIEAMSNPTTVVNISVDGVNSIQLPPDYF